jgi:hypothetical protein
VLQDVAVVHHGDPLGHAERDVEVVLDDDVAHVDGQRREEEHQLAPLGGREPGRRLIEQEEARRTGQRHADLELALLAVGQGRHRMVRDRLEPDSLEEIVGRKARGVRGARAQEAVAPARHAAHRQEQVVADREVTEQERRLVRPSEAHPDPLVWRERGDVLAEEADPPGRGREVAGDGVEQRGLAGAVGADQGAALPRGDGERDVLDRLERAEGPGDALEHESVTRRDRTVRARGG